MFVTFYSHKGGVGRTLALANAAYCLANDRQEPCKVLVWDFDLEAPGLQKVFKCNWQKEKLGFIDLISKFRQTREIHKINDYIHSTDVKGVDILPAGYENRSYGTKFGQLNWREFYSGGEGYEFIENLKKLVRDVKPAYDYVLIDSRTGFSDVSGICTLQLPDVVILVFRLNNQNIDGIQRTHKIIRAFSEEKPERRIDVIPVMSPVWPFDTSEGSSQINKARRIFGDLTISPISFDSALNYKEKILMKAEGQQIKSQIYADYKNLTFRLRTLNQDDPFAISRTARSQMELFDYERAYSNFKRLVSLRPKTIRYWLGLNSAAYSFTDDPIWKKKNQEVEELIDEEIKRDPTNIAPLLAKAQHLSQKEDYKTTEVERVLTKALELDPKLHRAYIQRGMLYFDTDNFKKAIADFTKLLELDIRDVMAYLYRAKSFSKLRKFSAAEKDMGNALRLDERDPSLYFERARIFLSQEKYSQAERDIVEHLAISPSNKHTKLFYIHILAGQDKFEEANKLLEELFDQGIGRIEKNLDFAEIYIVLGKFDKALELIKKTNLPSEHRLKEVAAILMWLCDALIFYKKTNKEPNKIQNFRSLELGTANWDWLEIRIFLKRSLRNKRIGPKIVELMTEKIGN